MNTFSPLHSHWVNISLRSESKPWRTANNFRMWHVRYTFKYPAQKITTKKKDVPGDIPGLVKQRTAKSKGCLTTLAHGAASGPLSTRTIRKGHGRPWIIRGCHPTRPAAKPLYWADSLFSSYVIKDRLWPALCILWPDTIQLTPASLSPGVETIWKDINNISGKRHVLLMIG